MVPLSVLPTIANSGGAPVCGGGTPGWTYWLDRPTGVRFPLLAGEGQGEGVVTRTEHDNLGRGLWTKTYASADFTLSAGELRGQSNVLYDPLGRSSFIGAEQLFRGHEPILTYWTYWERASRFPVCLD